MIKNFASHETVMELGLLDIHDVMHRLKFISMKYGLNCKNKVHIFVDDFMGGTLGGGSPYVRIIKEAGVCILLSSTQLKKT